MKTILAPALALLGHRLAMCQLVEMQFTSAIRVANCRDTIDVPAGSFAGAESKTFVGGRQTAMSSIKNQGGEVVGLSFQISGVNSATLAVALAEPIQGKKVIVWTAIMDPDTQVILDVVQSWAGTCDQMPISQGADSATVSVTAEHRGITFARPKGFKYTDGDQQRLFPGDTCLKNIVTQATHQDVWPAAAFFRQ